MTTKAVNTSYPRTKEAWFGFKMIVVAKFKVNRKKTKQNIAICYEISLFLPFLPFYLLWVSGLRGLMQTSEHAVFH